MLTFGGFLGINNVTPEHRQGEHDLLRAENVDIGLTGEVTRRGGFSAISDQCHKNLWQARGFMLATCGSALTAIHPGGTRYVIHPALGHDRVWYCNLPDGRTTFTNGLIHGVTDGVAAFERNVPEPASLGVMESAFGGLDAGQYRYHLTHVCLSSRLEGPAISSGLVEVSTGGMRLHALPQLEGHAINIYISGRDGEGAYLAGTTADNTIEIDSTNDALVLPCRTLGARAYPVGTVTASWRGRILVAVGDVLWASRPSAPHLCDWRDFKPMGARITAVQPVGEGVYVGTDDDLIFLSGSSWNDLAFVPMKTGPVVLGSGVEAPGGQIKVGDGTGSGDAMICIAGGEVVAGMQGGQVVSLSENRYRTKANEVWATFRYLEGVGPQYLAVPL